MGNWRKPMKNMILIAIASFFILSCTTTKNVENEEIQSEYSAEIENMNIKVAGPGQPIVAPSNNEQEMRAYTTGSMHLRENNLNEAEKYLKEAIELDPLFVDAMDHLGMVYRRQKRLDEAEEMYLKSISINDKNIVPYQNLAIVYRLKNRLDDAFELYKKMVSLDKNNPESYYGIGELFYKTGDYEKSMLFFDKAIELYIEQNSMVVYDAFYYKGMIYYKTGNYEEALRYFEEVQKVDPDNKTIEEIIGEIKNIPRFKTEVQ
jgi:tetratricopeptide (TPR) repeat protein